MNDNHTDDLYHHGVKGQKWGIRRYQNRDGSLTAAGRKRAGIEGDKSLDSRSKTKYRDAVKKKHSRQLREAKEAAENKSKKSQQSDLKPQKKLSDFTDEELRTLTARNRLEKDYMESLNQRQQASNLRAQLNPAPVSKGKKFMKELSDVAVPAVKKAGSKLLEDYLVKKGSEILGLNAKEASNSLSKLKRDAEEWELRGKIAKGKDAVDARHDRVTGKDKKKD